MRRSGFVRFAVGAAALLALASCAAPTSAPSTSPSPSPIAASPSLSPSPIAASPSPVASALAGGTKGYGDTAANPDNPYICVASSSVNGQVIAYVTVAGTDATAARSVCSTMENFNGGHSWVAVPLSASFSLRPLTTATGCYNTMGSVTARIYTASGANPLNALTLCSYPPPVGFGIT